MIMNKGSKWTGKWVENFGPLHYITNVTGIIMSNITVTSGQAFGKAEAESLGVQYNPQGLRKNGLMREDRSRPRVVCVQQQLHRSVLIAEFRSVWT